MEITVKFAQEDIESILKKHLEKQFEGVTFKVKHPYYCQDWMLESVDLEEEAKSAKVLADYIASKGMEQPVPLEPSDVVILTDIQIEADAMDKEAF